MPKSSYVTNNQGVKFARLAKELGILQDVFQDAYDTGVVREFLSCLKLDYPAVLEEGLTPEHEVSMIVDPGFVELWTDPRQITNGDLPTGEEVYTELKRSIWLGNTLSLGHLKWYEKYPQHIPADWLSGGIWLCGWASVSRDYDGYLRLPMLHCNTRPLTINWHWLDQPLDAGCRTGFHQRPVSP